MNYTDELQNKTENESKQSSKIVLKVYKGTYGRINSERQEGANP